MSKSEMIRSLYKEGKNLSEISRELNIRYQFVYNVVSRYCNKVGEEVRKMKEKSLSQIIREKYDEGMKVGEISKELNVNYVFVHQVIKKYREKKEKEKSE